MFSYCPTVDVAAYQGILTIVYGKHLYFDGSGGSGGSISFNGDFRTNGAYGAATLTNVVTPVVEAWATGLTQGIRPYALCHSQYDTWSEGIPRG